MAGFDLSETMFGLVLLVKNIHVFTWTHILFFYLFEHHIVFKICGITLMCKTRLMCLKFVLYSTAKWWSQFQFLLSDMSLNFTALCWATRTHPPPICGAASDSGISRTSVEMTLRLHSISCKWPKWQESWFMRRHFTTFMSQIKKITLLCKVSTSRDGGLLLTMLVLKALWHTHFHIFIFNPTLQWSNKYSSSKIPKKQHI